MPGREIATMSALQSQSLRMGVLSALLTALMAAGAYIIIPVGPVPIVLSNLFVLLAGLLLGSRWACVSTGLYLFLGAVGLPVFSGGGGGLGHLVGPTGGYLIGYLPAAALIGWISRVGMSVQGARPARTTGPAGKRLPVALLFDLLALLCGTCVIYTCGVLWLVVARGYPLSTALSLGVFPFLPGDALKIAAALSIIRFARPLLEKGKLERAKK